MAIQKIRINTNQLSSDAATVEESIKRVVAEAGKLETAYHALDDMWEGPASEVFKSVYEHDLEELKANIEFLRKFNAFETNARDKYDGCESEIGKIVSSFNW